MEQKSTEDTADIIVKASTEAVDCTGKTIHEGDIVEYEGLWGRRSRSTIKYYPEHAAFGYWAPEFGIWIFNPLTKKELSTLKVVGHKEAQ